ncbi:MAG TPA: GAF domain-containing sensor histidine kinase [Candidatus Polarisedimenticolia bacterium]|nr:GAF domain-containing sensor histidine kinase [Candidatus Polarisedimenticolia bacterium]
MSAPKVLGAAPLPHPGGGDERLLELMQIARSITSSLRLDEVLGRVIDGAVRFSGAQRGFLFLKSADGRLVRWPAPPDGAPPVEVSLSVAEEVARSGRPVHRDHLAGSDTASLTDSIVRLRLMAILCVPLLAQSEVIGVIYLDSRRPMPHQAHDLDLLEALAGLAAIAIQNSRLVEERLRAERTLALGRTARALVHDLRSPLTAIRALAELLHGRAAGDAATRRHLASIMDEADRLAELASDLLRFAGGAPPLRREAVVLGPYLTRLLEPLRPRLESSGVALVTDLEPTAVAPLDAPRAARVVHNLVANALDAMPDGGTLTVACGTTGGRAWLRIGDSGCGMSEAVRSRLFEPFFTHGKEHGTGLGLALARAIVEEHGGRIEVESAPGRGSVFTIELEAAPSA